MPSERAISQMVDVFTDVIDLGGVEERTAIVPNLTVIDAAPTGLTNFIIVQDDRDGDNILAKTVPGVVYTNNDKVNVLFIKGAEPIAFQQGSESSNAGLWEITPSTTTDIFYDKGKVGIGVSAALQLLHIESLSANAARMRITETGDTTSGHLSGIELYDTLTFKGGLFKKGDDHFIQLWDDTSARLTLDQSGNIGIGTVTPGNKLDVVTGATTSSIVHFGEVDNEGGYLTSTADHQIILSGGAEFVAGSWTARATDAALMSTDTGALTWFTNAGLVDGGVFVPTERMRLDTSGNLGIGTAGPDAKLDVLATTTQLRLTHTDGSKFVDFTLDTNHDLTIKPSSTGQVKLQPTTDSVDFFQVLDADGGTPILNVDSTNERVGIRNAAPQSQLEISAAANPTLRISEASSTTSYFLFQDTSANQAKIQKVAATGNINFDIDPIPSDNLGNAVFRFFRTTNTVGNKSIAIFKGDGSGTQHIQLGVDGLDSYFGIGGGNFGIGTAAPNAVFNVQESQAAGETIIDHENTAAVSTSNVVNYRTKAQSSTQARTIFQLKSSWSVTTDATRTSLVEFVVSSSGVSTTPITILGGNVGISAGTPLARLHVDQGGGGASIPVLYLDQADVSEEMIEFASTIGVGNAIEAVGAKTLTTTHFIKVTIPGGLTRYFPVGTIA